MKFVFWIYNKDNNESQMRFVKSIDAHCVEEIKLCDEIIGYELSCYSYFKYLEVLTKLQINNIDFREEYVC